MNVSRKTLEKHYNKRTEEVKVEQRRDYIEEVQLNKYRSVFRSATKG